MTANPETPDQIAALRDRIAAKKAEPPFLAFAEALAQAAEAGPDDVLADAVDLLREAAMLYDAREQPGSAALLRRLVRELTAAPAVVSSPPATDRATVRDRVAEALYRREWPLKQVWQQALPADRSRYEALADAVLAVLPPPADRAAVLLEVADWLKAWRPEFFERWAVVEQDRYEGGVDDAAAELRRLAAEAQQSEVEAAVLPAKHREVYDETRPLCACGRFWPCALADAEQPAVGARQPDTETQDACTCGSAGDAFVPAGHYADCPQADQPAGGAGGVADETTGETGEGDA